MVLLFHFGEESVNKVARRRDVLGLFQETLQPAFFVADFSVDFVLHILYMSLTSLVNLDILISIAY